MSRSQRASVVCFACTRCNYPVCEAADLLIAPDEHTDPAHRVFRYHLDDLLDHTDAVPCYSADDEVSTWVGVSEQLLHALPLVPSARLVVLDAIADARSAAREQPQLQQQHRNAADNDDDDRRSDVAGGGTTARRHERAHGDAEEAVVGGDVGERRAQARRPTAPPRRCYVTRTQQRTDLVCVRHSVVDDGGVRVCARHDAAGDAGAACAEGYVASDTACTGTRRPRAHLGDDGCDDRRGAQASGGGGGASLPPEHVTAAVPAAASSSSSSSTTPAWSSTLLQHERRWTTGAPDNGSLREEYVTLTRHRAVTARGGWFRDVDCVRRVECPDCCLSLGYVFVRVRSDGDKDNNNDDDDNMDVQADGATVPTVRATAAEATSAVEAVHPQEVTAPTTPPPVFLGLELKKLRERQWTLQDFHTRYTMSHSLPSFRILVAGAEEREQLHAQLTALRLQAELYREMLTVSKNKSDVNEALTQSQTRRIALYETKVQSLEQAIRALREHNDVLTRCVQQHAQLSYTTRVKMQTQDTQIQMQTTLIQQQGELIRVQRDQMRLMQETLTQQQQQQQQHASARLKQRSGDTSASDDTDVHM